MLVVSVAWAGRSSAAQPLVLLFQLSDPVLGGEAGLPFLGTRLPLRVGTDFGLGTRLSLGVAFRLRNGPGLAFFNAGFPLLKTAFALSISPGPLALERGDAPPRRRVVLGSDSLPPGGRTGSAPAADSLDETDYMPVGVWRLGLPESKPGSGGCGWSSCPPCLGQMQHPAHSCVSLAATARVARGSLMRMCLMCS